MRGYNEETESFTKDVEILSGKIADLTKTASAPGGISLFTDDTKTEYKSTYQILKDISEIYDDLTDAQQAPLLEALAGKRQGQIVAATLSNFEAVEQALKNMEEASGSADRELQVYQESMAYKSNLLKETWTGFWQSFLQRDELKEFMDTAIELSETLVREFEKLSPIVDVFSELFKAITKVVDVLGGLGTVLTTIALNTVFRGTGFFGNQQMFTVIANGATTATGKIQLFGKSLSDINRDYKVMQTQGGIFASGGMSSLFGKSFTKVDTQLLNQYFAKLQTGLQNSSTSLIGFSGNLDIMSTQGRAAVLQLQTLNAEFVAGSKTPEQYRAKLAELGAQFQTLSVEEQAAAMKAKVVGFALNTAINVGIVLAITAIVTAIQKAKQAEEELRQSIQETADEIKTETEKISELTEEYKNQYEEYQKLLEKEQDATSIKESLDKTTQNLLKSLGVEDTEIQKLIGDYQTLNDKIDEYNLKKAETNKDDLTQEVVAEKKELRDAVGFWSNNDFAYNSFKNWAADEGDEVAKQVSSIMYDVANKYNNVIETTQEFLKNGETGDLLTLTFSTNDNYQSIKQTIDAYDYFISEIEKLDKSLWGNEDGAYHKLWSDAVNEKNKIKSALGEYEDALNAESDNLSTIYILTQKQNNELPKTIDEYKKFRQAIIDAAKAGKQGQYSIDADIEASIDRVLAGMSEFQNFISATNTEAETNITLTFAISDEDLKSGINRVKETISDTVKNANLFDTALESIDKSESISFDDMQELIGFGVSPQDFAKTADGYTIAFDKLSTARQDYINSTYDDIEKIKSKNVGFRTQIEENIKSLEKQRDLYIESQGGVINSSNSKKVSEYNQAIQVQKDLLTTLDDVNAESDLILGEVSDAYVTAKQAVVDMNTALDDCDKKTKTIKTAMSEMNEDGHISASTYAEIAAKGSDYADCLSVVDGKLTVNVTKLKELEKQEFLNAISANKLTIATLQLAAASTAASGGDVSGIVAQIDTLLKENKVYLALIDEIENAKPDDKKTSSKTTDTNKEAFENLYNEKKHLLEMGRLSEKDYIDWLDGAYKQYFSDLATYQDEYNKYEEEVFKSRKEREKDLFETKIDNYETLAEKALDDKIADFGDNSNKYDYARAQYANMIADTESRIDSLVASGLTNVDDEIKTLRDNISKYYDKIDEITEKEYKAEQSYIKQLKDDYKDMMDDRIDALKDAQDTAEKAYESQIKSLEKQIDIIDKQIDAEEEKSKVQEKQNKILDAQNKLVEAQNKLKKAQVQNRLVYTGNGQYEARVDEEALQEAQKDVADAEKDLQEAYQEDVKSKLEAQKKLLEEQKDVLNEQKDNAKDYYDNIIDKLEKERDTQEKIYERLDKIYDNLMDDTQSESNQSLVSSLNGSDVLTKAFESLSDNDKKSLEESGVVTKGSDGKYSLDYEKLNTANTQVVNAVDNLNQAVKENTDTVTTNTDTISGLTKTEEETETPTIINGVRATTRAEWEKKHTVDEWRPEGRASQYDGMTVEEYKKAKFGGQDSFKALISKMVGNEVKPSILDNLTTSKPDISKIGSEVLSALGNLGSPTLNYTCNISVEGSADKKTVDAISESVNTQITAAFDTFASKYSAANTQKTYSRK